MQSTSGSRAAPESDSQAPGYPAQDEEVSVTTCYANPEPQRKDGEGGVWQYRAGQRVSELLDTDFNGN